MAKPSRHLGGGSEEPVDVVLTQTPNSGTFTVEGYEEGKPIRFYSYEARDYIIAYPVQRAIVMGAIKMYYYGQDYILYMYPQAYGGSVILNEIITDPITVRYNKNTNDFTINTTLSSETGTITVDCPPLYVDTIVVNNDSKDRILHLFASRNWCATYITSSDKLKYIELKYTDSGVRFTEKIISTT